MSGSFFLRLEGTLTELVKNIGAGRFRVLQSDEIAV